VPPEPGNDFLEPLFEPTTTSQNCHDGSITFGADAVFLGPLLVKGENHFSQA